MWGMYSLLWDTVCFTLIFYILFLNFHCCIHNISWLTHCDTWLIQCFMIDTLYMINASSLESGRDLNSGTTVVRSVKQLLQSQIFIPTWISVKSWRRSWEERSVWLAIPGTSEGRGWWREAEPGRRRPGPPGCGQEGRAADASGGQEVWGDRQAQTGTDSQQTGGGYGCYAMLR